MILPQTPGGWVSWSNIVTVWLARAPNGTQLFGEVPNISLITDGRWCLDSYHCFHYYAALARRDAILGDAYIWGDLLEQPKAAFKVSHSNRKI